MVFAAGEVSGPLETAKNGSWKEPSFDLKRKGKVVHDDFYKVTLGGAGSRNNQVEHGKGISAIRMTQLETAGSEMPEEHDDNEEHDDLEGINAFNTDDALRQDVNPVHAINPATVFGQETDFNSTRTAKEGRFAATPGGGEYKFSTPSTVGRTHGQAYKVNEFDHNKENANSRPDSSFSKATSQSGKNFAL